MEELQASIDVAKMYVDAYDIVIHEYMGDEDWELECNQNPVPWQINNFYEESWIEDFFDREFGEWALNNLPVLSDNVLEVLNDPPLFPQDFFDLDEEHIIPEWLGL